jgi:hypothetical protein
LKDRVYKLPNSLIGSATATAPSAPLDVSYKFRL